MRKASVGRDLSSRAFSGSVDPLTQRVQGVTLIHSAVVQGLPLPI